MAEPIEKVPPGPEPNPKIEENTDTGIPPGVEKYNEVTDGFQAQSVPVPLEIEMTDLSSQKVNSSRRTEPETAQEKRRREIRKKQLILKQRRKEAEEAGKAELVAQIEAEELQFHEDNKMDLDEATVDPASNPPWDPDAPLMMGSESSDYFPLSGLPTISVRRREGAMRVATYINRHGSEHVWYTFGPLQGDVLSQDLLDVANPMNRRISQQHQEPKINKVKAEQFLTIIHVAFKYDWASVFPVDAAELLNPQKVKKADQYPTMKQRSQYTKEHDGKRLDKYPVHAVLVMWRDQKKPTWEMASELKALLSKQGMSIEKLIYENTKERAALVERYLEANRKAAARDATKHVQSTVVQSIESDEHGSSTIGAVKSSTAVQSDSVPSRSAEAEIRPSNSARPPVSTIPDRPETGLPTPPSSKSPEREKTPFVQKEFEAFSENFCKTQNLDPSNKMNKVKALGEYIALLDMGIF